MEIKLKRNYPALIATVFIFGFTSCRDEIKSCEKENEGIEITQASEKVIWAIFEDSKGDFWFGTNEGVNRYDGKSLTHYSEIDGLGDNQVRTIQEDRYGNIWFDGGAISSYDGEKFTIHVTKDEHPSDIIENDWRIDTNDLWFECWGRSGVYRYDGQNFIHLAFPVPNDDDHSSNLTALPG